MKKAGVFILILGLTPLLAGLYGILHDQLTYSISPEYYYKFKFRQFHINASFVETPRSGVAIVGFLATWWFGIILGIFHGFVGLFQKDARAMWIISSRAILINLIVAFIVGLTGLAYGWFYLSVHGVDWWLPDDLIDKNSFITVGSMHNFSYMGGLVGLIAGIIYQVRMKRKNAVLNPNKKSPTGL